MPGCKIRGGKNKWRMSLKLNASVRISWAVGATRRHSGDVIDELRAHPWVTSLSPRARTLRLTSPLTCSPRPATPRRVNNNMNRENSCSTMEYCVWSISTHVFSVYRTDNVRRNPGHEWRRGEQSKTFTFYSLTTVLQYTCYYIIEKLQWSFKIRIWYFCGDNRFRVSALKNWFLQNSCLCETDCMM